jgi:aminoglycoside phosphotransferase (APT) family kinase protein
VGHVPDHSSVDANEVLAALGLPPAGDVRRMPGAEATVWRVLVDGVPLAVRLHRLESTTVERELVALRIARTAGVPVPDVVATGTWQDRHVAVTSWCAGETVGELLRTTSGDEQTGVAHRFGHAQAVLHSTELGHSDLAELRAIGRRVPQVDAPGPDTLLHLDFHPFNVLDDGSRVTGIVDWANASVGDRRFDIARTRGLFALAGVFAPEIAEHADAAAEELAVWWAQGYSTVLPMPDDDEMAPFFAAAASTMAADWEPRTRAGEVDGSILAAIERWAARWRTGEPAPR